MLINKDIPHEIVEKFNDYANKKGFNLEVMDDGPDTYMMYVGA